VPCLAVVVSALAAPLLACRAPTPPSTTATPAEPVRSLAALKAVPIVVTPAHTVRGGDVMGWSSRLVSREFLRGLDAEIAYVLRERGMDSVWRLPERLMADYRRNPTLGVNPQQLSADQLRNPALKVAQRVMEPLATQLRALAALHDGRLVLVPVEVRFEPEGTAPAGQPAPGRAVLRLVLVDARSTEVRWIGEVKSDVATSPSKAVEATLGLRVGDLVTAP